MQVSPLFCKNPQKPLGPHIGKNTLKSNFFCQLNLTKVSIYLLNRDTYLTFIPMVNNANRLAEHSDLDVVHAEIADSPDESTLKEWVRNGVNIVATIGLVAAGTIGQTPEAKAADAKKNTEVAQVLVLPGLTLNTGEMVADARANTDTAKWEADKAAENAEVATRLADETKEAVCTDDTGKRNNPDASCAEFN